MTAAMTAGECHEVLRAWITVRRKLRRAVPSSTYRIWLRPVRPAGSDGDCLLLTAPEGIRTWVERRYTTLIREALRGTGYTDVEWAGSQ